MCRNCERYLVVDNSQQSPYSRYQQSSPAAKGGGALKKG
nr:MAG TPA: hypothetical protein [Caudoviricetes sp.]